MIPSPEHEQPAVSGGRVDLTVVIPAYNESSRIVPTLASTIAYLDSLDLTWEILVSDDGSTDDTAAKVTRLNAPGVRVVGGHPNLGKGGAVRRGLLESNGRAILVSDADMSTPIQEVSPMLAALEPQAMVIGSRSLNQANVTGKSRLRHLMSDGLQLIVRHGLGIKVADTQCGFKLMGADVADLLTSEQTIDGFSFDLEWLVICAENDIAVTEHAVEWFDAPGSTVDPLKDSIAFLRDIARVRWTRRSKRKRRGGLSGGSLSRPHQPIHLGMVTSLPPSTRTLNEYGLHLVNALVEQPEIARITVLRDDTVDTARELPSTESVAAWSPDDITNPIRILRAARAAKVDAVMFNIQFASFGDRRVPAALGLLTPVLLRLFRIPTVVLLHNLVDTVDLEQAGFTDNKLKAKVLTGIGRGLTRMILFANRVAVTLPTYHKILTGRYGARNVYLSPHGTFPHPELPPSDRRLRAILTFGKFGTYKRVEELVAAFAMLRGQGREDIELVIAGSNATNSPNYLESVAAGIPEGEPIRFTGYVDEDDVPQLFDDAEIVVFPYTATTGSSGPLHQAGAAGKAVVLPAIGDFVAVIEEEGFVGELFEPGDAESLARALGLLLDDDELRTAMGTQNRRAASALNIDLIAGWHALHIIDAIGS